MSVVNHLSQFDFNKIDLWNEFSLYLCPELKTGEGPIEDLVFHLDASGQKAIINRDQAKNLIVIKQNEALERFNYTERVEGVFYTFKTTIQLALQAGDIKGRVLLFPTPNDLISYGEKKCSFLATLNDGRIIPVLKRSDEWVGVRSTSCPFGIWEQLKPRLQAFLHSSYGIHWTEKEDNSLVHRFLETYKGDVVNNCWLTDVCKAAYRTLNQTKIQQNQISEITLSWKPWVVQAFPEYPFPQMSANDVLVTRCVRYIVENIEEDQWELIGELGAVYDSKDLLQAYDCYRIRQGKPLPFLMKAVFAKHGLFVPPPSIEVCVAADVSNLGLYCEPLWTDEPPTPLTLTHRGWVGRVPAGKEFKFVQIGEGNSVKWEIRNWNRKMEEQVPTPEQPEPAPVYFAAGQVQF